MSPSANTRVEWARRLAHSIVSDGYATDAEVAPVLSEATDRGSSFPALLISRDVTSQEVVLGLLSQLTRLPVVDLDHDRPSDQALASTPVTVAREYGAVGYRLDGDQLTTAFGDPPDEDDVRALSVLVGHVVVPVLANPLAIERVLGVDRATAAAPATAASAADRQRDGAAHRGGTAGNGVRPAVEQRWPERRPACQPESRRERRVRAAPRRPAALRRERRRLGPPPHHGAAGVHPAATVPSGPSRAVPVLDNEIIRDMVFGILPQTLRERFEAEKELDTSHSIVGVGRFRLNVFQQRGTVAAALRAIPHEIPPFDVLGIPESIRSFTEMRHGLVLVTGPTGSGKSTTLASLVDIINRTKPLHIVTVEDPIEFLHNHKRAIVNQREVGQDTMSFSEALRRVLREDPDVILVGEMRDLETISMALTAAETGHLVFGTLHTQDAPQTIDRIIDVFPTNQQEQIRTMLAGVARRRGHPAAAAQRRRHGSTGRAAR